VIEPRLTDLLPHPDEARESRASCTVVVPFVSSHHAMLKVGPYTRLGHSIVDVLRASRAVGHCDRIGAILTSPSPPPAQLANADRSGGRACTETEPDVRFTLTQGTWTAATGTAAGPLDSCGASGRLRGPWTAAGPLDGCGASGRHGCHRHGCDGRPTAHLRTAERHGAHPRSECTMT
jgi:hypothetical protein